MNECTLIIHTAEYPNSRVVIFAVASGAQDFFLPDLRVCLLRALSLRAGGMPTAVAPLKLSD